MKNTLETRLGIFVALAVIAAVLIVETIGGVERFRGGTTYYALFNTAKELKTGDRVKMAGVEVGRIEDIRLEPANNKVRVRMKIRREVEVKTDSAATIEFAGLLGQNFVALDFGSPAAPRATEGSLLTTIERPDLGVVMQKLESVATGVENLTKSFTGDKIDNLLGPFTEFLKANREPLTETFANLRDISGKINHGEGTVGLLINTNALYNSLMVSITNLQDTAGDIRVTVNEARKAVDQINSGQGTIGKLLHDEALYRETTEGMTNLKEILQKINQGQGSVGKLVNDQEFYRNIKLTLQKMDKATEGLEDQGPLTVLGIMVNNLF
jgi:phospholipid/cholesterol/gamma-HCH transport system substrate-binding protein